MADIVSGDSLHVLVCCRWCKGTGRRRMKPWGRRRQWSTRTCTYCKGTGEHVERAARTKAVEKKPTDANVRQALDIVRRHYGMSPHFREAVAGMLEELLTRRKETASNDQDQQPSRERA